MRGKLIVDGNAVYEIDEECLRRKRILLEDRVVGSEGDLEEELYMPAKSKTSQGIVREKFSPQAPGNT